MDPYLIQSASSGLVPWMWTSLSLLIDSIMPVVPYEVHCSHRPAAGCWNTRPSLTLLLPLGSVLLTDVSSSCVSKSWWRWLPSSGQDSTLLLTSSPQPCPGKTCSCFILSCSDLSILCKSRVVIFADAGSLVLQLDTYTAPNPLLCISSYHACCLVIVNIIKLNISWVFLIC